MTFELRAPREVKISLKRKEEKTKGMEKCCKDTATAHLYMYSYR